MQITHYAYSALTVDRVVLPAGESIHTDAEHNDTVFGWFLVRGRLVCTDGREDVIGYVMEPTGELHEPITTTTSNTSIAEAEAEWYCFSSNGASREVTSNHVDGNFTLPADRKSVV